MPHPTAAPGEDRSSALALVNTEFTLRGTTMDLLADGPAANRWLADHSPTTPDGVSEQEVQRLRDLRAAVRAAFTARITGERPDPLALLTLNAAAAAVPRAPQVLWAEHGPKRTWMMISLDAPQLAEAALAEDAIDVLTGPLATSLRSCDAHGCVRLFLQDHGRRRWCSNTCGDRVRVARHYAKSRTNKPRPPGG